MPNASAASYDHSHMNWTYQIPLAVSWEIDIFGKLLAASLVSEFTASTYCDVKASSVGMLNLL